MKKFIKRHKKELIFGGVAIAAGVAYVYGVNKRIGMLTETVEMVGRSSDLYFNNVEQTAYMQDILIGDNRNMIRDILKRQKMIIMGYIDSDNMVEILNDIERDIQIIEEL